MGLCLAQLGRGHGGCSNSKKGEKEKKIAEVKRLLEHEGGEMEKKIAEVQSWAEGTREEEKKAWCEVEQRKSLWKRE